MKWQWGHIIRLGGPLLVLTCDALGQPDPPASQHNEDLPGLLQSLRKTVGLSGNIVQSLAVPTLIAIVFLNEMFRMSTVHASILRLGSGLSTNGQSSAIAILNPFTLSLSKPVLSLSKGANKAI